MRAGLPILDMTPLLGHGDAAAREALAPEIRAADDGCAGAAGRHRPQPRTDAL